MRQQDFRHALTGAGTSAAGRWANGFNLVFDPERVADRSASFSSSG